MRGWIGGVALVLSMGMAAADPSADGTPGSDASSGGTAIRLFDVEPGAAEPEWRGSGEVKTSVVANPGGGPSGAPGRHGLAVHARPESAIATRFASWPEGARRHAAFTLWVHRTRAEAERRPGGRLEIQLVERDGRARFRRLVELSHEGWSRIHVPLRWFRWGDGRVPRWDRIGAVAFHFPDGAELILDGAGLEPVADGVEVPFATALRELAFPEPGVAVTVHESADALVLSGARDLDGRALAGHLGAVRRAVYETFPFFDPPFQPPAVVVFATQAEYQAFPPRFARKLNALSAPPQSGGYTLQGVATSWWDPAKGQDRPVYTHEYVHALLSFGAMLNNHGEWVQEGLATLFQLRFHPQADLAELVRNGIEDPKRHLALPVLCKGEGIPLGRYWQAMTLWQTLLARESFAARIPALFRAFQERGSTDLGPLIEPVLGTTWEELTAAWLEHCRTAYAGKQE